MKSERRKDRLNSLLREVISDVIRREVKNPKLPEFITVTRVEITKDFRHAKVYISVIGDEKVKAEATVVLQSAAGYIGTCSAQQVTIRYFPKLTFLMDDSLETQMQIEGLISEIQDERTSREEPSDGCTD